MLSQRPLDPSKVTPERLALDYGEQESRAMLTAFEESKVARLEIPWRSLVCTASIT